MDIRKQHTEVEYVTAVQWEEDAGLSYLKHSATLCRKEKPVSNFSGITPGNLGYLGEW